MKSIVTTKDHPMSPVGDSQAINPEQLLMAAVQAQMAPEVIRELLDMRRQLQQELAREAYFRAKREFKLAMIDRRPAKTKIVRDRDGSERYRYAPIDEIQRCVDGPLVENGFTYAWEPAIEDGVPGIACVLTHVSGHSERSWFPAEPDTKAYMAQNQKIAAARTFACRYTLQDVTSVIADEDTDGVIESPTTLLDDGEITAAKAVLETASDLQETWHRIGQQVRQRDDHRAYGVLKAFVIDLVTTRKAAEEKRAELNSRPQKQTSPGGGNTALITEEEANKLVKRIEQLGYDWVWFLREFNLPPGTPFDIRADAYPECMAKLWAFNPIRNGVTCISLAQNQRLHAAMNDADVTRDEFKAYHGLESTKDIDLADFDKMLDFAGILAERQNKDSADE